MRTPALIIGCLLAVSVTAQQIPLPAFTNTYANAAQTRGFYFQAPVGFAITGLRVPDETLNGTQNVEVVLLSGDPAVGATTITSSLFYSAGQPSANIIALNVAVLPGDWVGILGACGTTTMNNSYGPSGFASNVVGAPITLSRLMLQSNLNAASGLGQTVFTNTASIGRVEVYAGGGAGTFATNTVLGEGCISEFASAYENFAAGANDLAGSKIFWQATSPGQIGIVDITSSGIVPIGSLGTPTTVALTDDSSASVGTLGLEVGSNGWVAFGPGNSTAFTPNVATMLANPSEAFYFWHDMNPVAGGSVQYEESGTQALITYDGVANFGGAAGDNTIQVFVDTAAGTVEVRLDVVSAAGNGWIVGYSPAGANLDPGSIDISAAAVVITGAGDTIPLSLAANSRPVLGTNWDLTISEIPASTVFGVTIIGLADPMLLDLGFLGMPGCQLRSNLDFITGPWTPTGTTETYSFAIPATPAALIGFELFTQAATFGAPAVNAFGAITSNGVNGTLGDI